MTANVEFGSLLAAASPGPLLDAELFPLGGQGRLRATYNWLYSSLNCDPNDSSAFVWRISNLGGGAYSLSPRDGYNGMTIFASVRGDIGNRVQVQAPYSADWITAVGGDEQIAIEAHELLVVAFKGFNGQYIAVDGQQTAHDGHSGFLVHSNGSSDPRARLWFMGVVQLLQSAS